jgi:hypothetical protein
MTATVVIAERNGAPAGSETDGITNTNMGSVDAVNLVAADNPIVAGTNSFEKYQRFHVSAMGGSSKIKTLKVWASAALAAEATHLTSATTTSYGGARSYATPTATASTAATLTMPIATPAAANLGIGGALTGELTDVGYSDYLIMQIQLTGAATAGTTVTMNYQYDEIA